MKPLYKFIGFFTVLAVCAGAFSAAESVSFRPDVFGVRAPASPVAFKDFFAGSAGVFTLDPLYDGLIAGGGAALTGTAFVLDKVNGTPVWDGTAYDKDSVNPFDRWAMRPYSRAWHISGTVTEALAMLTPAVLAAADKEEWGVIGVMYAESVLWSYGLKETVKTFVERKRPYMYFDGAPSDKISDGDFARSFPSGHTTMAFNGAVFTSYVFAKYFPDSKLKIPVIAGSMSIAVATAVQRILSGNHFMTDVLAGAVLGSATGFLVPFLHTLPLADKGLRPVVTPASMSLQYRW